MNRLLSLAFAKTPVAVAATTAAPQADLCCMIWQRNGERAARTVGVAEPAGR
jgi:hypothetical protein